MRRSGPAGMGRPKNNGSSSLSDIERERRVFGEVLPSYSMGGGYTLSGSGGVFSTRPLLQRASERVKGGERSRKKQHGITGLFQSEISQLCVTAPTQTHTPPHSNPQRVHLLRRRARGSSCEISRRSNFGPPGQRDRGSHDGRHIAAANCWRHVSREAVITAAVHLYGPNLLPPASASVHTETRR